jgi:quinol monooxygenase YgiN
VYRASLLSRDRSDLLLDGIWPGWLFDRRVKMNIKVIVELKAYPGKRDELRAVFESMLAEHGSDVPGFLGSSRYERLDDPDVLVEVAEWASSEARDAHMKEAAAAGTYAPLLGLVAEPFRVAVLSPLP